MEVKNKAALNVAVGSSGSGKSHWIKAELAAAHPQRLIVCDPDGEYDKHGTRVRTLAELVRATVAPQFAVIFTPADDPATGTKQFAFMCAAAWHIATELNRPLTFAVDELAEYVTAWKAPSSWRRLVKRGRKYGVTVYAGSQRPAEIDKTIWGNASLIRSGRLSDKNDQATVGRALGVKPDELGALSNHAWIALDRNTGRLRRGL